MLLKERRKVPEPKKKDIMTDSKAFAIRQWFPKCEAHPPGGARNPQEGAQKVCREKINGICI
jgi:hypothetical protein